MFSYFVFLFLIKLSVSTKILVEKQCTVDQLLPLPCDDMDGKITTEWKDVVEYPPYDCTCATMKSRYFCPKLNGKTYNKWVPDSISKNECYSEIPEQGNSPLPEMSNIYFYGNSHMRQVVESLMCIYEDNLTYKIMNDKTLSPDTQCRDCSRKAHPSDSFTLKDTLIENKCITEEDGENCSCNDGGGYFVFDNGAAVKYMVADRQYKDYDDLITQVRVIREGDIFFINSGNMPTIGVEEILKIAEEIHSSGAKLFFLSNYYYNPFTFWTNENKKKLEEYNATYLNITCITNGIYDWRKGEVEGGEPDGHFCLPGPPNEIAFLILRLIWAQKNEF